MFRTALRFVSGSGRGLLVRSLPPSSSVPSLITVMADEQQPPGQHPQPGSLLPTGLQGTESSALQLKIKNSIW